MSIDRQLKRIIRQGSIFMDIGECFQSFDKFTDQGIRFSIGPSVFPHVDSIRKKQTFLTHRHFRRSIYLHDCFAYSSHRQPCIRGKRLILFWANQLIDCNVGIICNCNQFFQRRNLSVFQLRLFSLCSRTMIGAIDHLIVKLFLIKPRFFSNRYNSICNNFIVNLHAVTSN